MGIVAHLLLPLLFLLTRHHFLLTLDCGPVYAITFGLATSAEDREGIQPRVDSKDLFPILTLAYVVNTLKRLALLVQILDGGFVGAS